MFNVIKSVTRNGRSILLTALLALILVYLFSIVGFLFLKDDFILEVDRLPDSKAKGWVVLGLVGHCGTLHTHLGVCWVGIYTGSTGLGVTERTALCSCCTEQGLGLVLAEKGAQRRVSSVGSQL